MKNHTRSKRSRTARRARLAASALALAGAVGGTSGILAGPGDAAPTRKLDKASYGHRVRGVKRPKLRHGVLTVTGTEAADTIALRLRAGDPGVLEVDVGAAGPAEFAFDRDRVRSIVVDAGGGSDLVRIDDANGAFTDTIPTTIAGDGGNDFLLGGAGAERLVGGPGIDSIDGNRGNDLALLGSGDDVFVWDPGDGSDVVEGQDGTDTMLFNGADIAERVALTANGNRLRFLRDPGRVTMDTAGVERVDFSARGGADVVTVGDLRGTDVRAVGLDLGLDGSGDGQEDQVAVDGTAGDDTIDVGGDASRVTVSGGQPVVSIVDHERTDGLVVTGLAGDDTISAAGLAAQAITLTLDGGAGADTLSGGKGAEKLVGGDDADSIDGNGGSDVALLGPGDDTFVWDPGDGSDVVEGEDGTDTMLFNGADAAERVSLSANGSRLRFFRDPGAVTMDTAGVEAVDFDALGGADVVTVDDLTGTDVRSVDVDLAGILGGANGDAQADRVVANGTDGDDAITVAAHKGGVTVGGLGATIGILHAEAPNDRLEINTLDGNDTVDAGGFTAGVIGLVVDGALIQ